jgi:hypothetical protein
VISVETVNPASHGGLIDGAVGIYVGQPFQREAGAFFFAADPIH